MLLHAAQQHAALGRHAPHPHRPVRPAAHHLVAAGAAGDGRHAAHVRIVHDVEQLARLRPEGPDLAVGPAREDGAAVPREGDAEAVHAADLHAQQLRARARVPHPHLPRAARREHVRVAHREDDVVDTGGVAGGPQLRLQRLRFDQVRRARPRPHEHNLARGVERQGRDGPRPVQRHRPLHLEALRVHDGHGAVAGAHQHAAPREPRHGSHALAQPRLGPHVLEQLRPQVHLEHVPRARPGVAVLVGLVHEQVLEGPLQLAQVAVHGPHLAVGEVEVPHAHVQLARRHDDELVAPGELDGVARLVGRGGAAHRLARLEVPHHQTVVVLSAYRRQPFLVAGEGY
mmetsp:Transcript_27034/g.71188  ORF Transcript_27034/g.71188 Transcript_27034/m.71188 type:complete len:343 (+) Transcript_27034:90-1118(+)